jgi:RNA polymerase sigma-70 factor (ECF subfamily)
MKETRTDRFIRLYSPVNDRFERFCKARAYGAIDFKDLMHDTLIVAFEKLDQLKSEQAFLHFLFGTAARIMANKAKKKSPILSDSMTHLESQHSTEQTSDLQFEIANLYTQLSKLDEVTRDCLILFEISGFSIREIMDIQKSGESAVKQRLRRGREQLIERMKASENETSER